MIRKQRIIGSLTALTLPLLFMMNDACAHESAAGIGFLHPKGLVAAQQRTLLFDSVALMLSVVIPVIILSFWFALRYSVRHGKGKSHHYEPDLKENMLLEVVWWAVPAAIVAILGVLLWNSAHRLDPYKPLDVPGETLRVEVVALPWKWLFIYPEQHVATLNVLELPVNRQVEFWITADAPMSSFAIPQLGSQIYAMAGMRTRLHLYPTEIGTYRGLNMQFNGAGFSDMHFKTNVVSAKDFDQWVAQSKQAKLTLSKDRYKALAKPSTNVAPETYNRPETDLFTWVMQKYTQPPKNDQKQPQ